jgi:hypothetical protein
LVSYQKRSITYDYLPSPIMLASIWVTLAISVCTAEPGAEEAFRAIPCNREARGPASRAQYVHVIIRHPLTGRIVIMTQRRALADHFIGSRRLPAAAAQQNATHHVSTRP